MSYILPDPGCYEVLCTGPPIVEGCLGVEVEATGRCDGGDTGESGSWWPRGLLGPPRPEPSPVRAISS